MTKRAHDYLTNQTHMIIEQFKQESTHLITAYQEYRDKTIVINNRLRASQGYVEQLEHIVVE